MLILHHLRQSRSFRIIWLLEELKLDYKLISYDRKNGLAPKTLKKVHPMGKAPILQDGKQTLVESAHIIEYVIDYYDNNASNNNANDNNANNNSTNNNHATTPHSLITGKLLRPDYGTKAYEQYRYWLHFAESSLMPLLVMRLAFDMSIKKSPIGIKQVAKLIKRGVEKGYLTSTLHSELALLDKHLANNKWLCGQMFTAADIHLAFGIEQLNTKEKNQYRHLFDWLKRCQNRPAYQIAKRKP